MTGKNRLPDVLMRVVEGPVSFDVYEPSNVPGYNSNIAQVFRCSENQTNNLLKAIEVVEGDHHYTVERKPVKEPESGSKDKQRPRKFRVTVSPA